MNHPANERYIYLVFSSTPNAMGHMIRGVTQYKYNHISVSLSPTLSPMYSFARYYKDTPLYGGFVNEGAQRFLGNAKHGIAHIAVCAVPVSDKQQRRAKQYIDKLNRQREQYIYNTVSAIAFPLGYNVRIDRAMTCIEFAIEVLRRACAPLSNMIPSFCTIRALEELYSPYSVYTGPFTHADVYPESHYFARHSPIYRAGHTLSNLGKLFCRMLSRRA